MPISSVAGGLIGGGVQAISGLVGAFMQKKENQRQRDYESAAYDKNVAVNRENWNMENAYNTPEMQMQRLKSAGLNPNLMYGSPQGGGNAGSMPGSSPNTSNSTKTVNPLEKMGNPVAEMYNLQQQSAQTNLLKQQVETQASVASLNAVTEALRGLQGTQQALTTQYDKDSYNTRLRTLTETQNKLLADIANTQASTRSTDANTINTMANTQATKDRNKRENQLQPYSIDKIRADIENTIANTNERKANLGLIASNKAKLDQETQWNILSAEAKKQGVNLDATGANKIIDYMSAGVGHTAEQIKQFVKSLLKK